MTSRYYIKVEGVVDWTEVSERVFRQTERNAGFNRPTGGFSGRGLQGRIREAEDEV